MDAFYTGNKILQLRKRQNMTQKDLAILLNVTDKAVSKWERGLNFPDLLTMEKIAEIFNTSIVELLGIENCSSQQVASEITDLANGEKQGLLKIIRNRGLLTVIIGTMIYVYMIYISKLLYDRQMYSINILGATTWIALIVGNGITSVNYANRLLGKQSIVSKIWQFIRRTKTYEMIISLFSKIGKITGYLFRKSPINKIIDNFFDEK